MSLVGSNALAGASGQGGGGYEIERSLRFNGADSAYLNRTLNATGSGTTGTYSFWIKRSKLLDSGRIINVGNYSAGLGYPTFYMQWNGTNDKLIAYCYYNGDVLNLETDAQFRDTSAWYHVVLKIDTTQATNTNRATFYVNGVEQTITATTWPDQNDNVLINLDTHPAYIGCRESLSQYLNGYLADLYFIDGQALAASDFGEYDDNNVWQPKKYAGSYGTNGFHLDFSDNSSDSALGTDSSGTSNDWTVNNLTALGNDYENAVFTENSTTYNSSASGTNYYTGTGANLFDNNTSTAVGGYNISASWLYFRPATAITGVTSLEIYGSYNENLKINGTNYSATFSTTNAWVTVTSPPSTISEIAFQGMNGYGAAPRAGGIKVNGVVLTSALASNTDSLRDSPTNGTQSDTGAGGEISGNYCVLNAAIPLQDDSLSDGNLKLTGNYGNYKYPGHVGTIAAPAGTGKWYWEIDIGSAPSYTMLGIVSASETFDGRNGYAGSEYKGCSVYVGYNGTGYQNVGATVGTSYSALSAATLVGVLFDAGAGTLKLSYNGVEQSTIFTGIPTNISFAPFITHYGENLTYTFNFGQRPFAYDAPSGYKCLCTANLPDPTIEDPSKYFDVKTFAANNGSQSISLGFSPDLVWTKSRTHSVEGQIFDKVRGNNQEMSPNATRAERTLANSLTLDSSGFTMPSNNNNANWTSSSGGGVGWAWDAGSSTVTNTDGSLSAQVRANPSAGFSIVTFTGTGSSASVGHGLNAAPSMVIAKNRDASNDWPVWHANTSGATYTLYLNGNAAEGTESAIWPSAPTSSVVNVGDGAVINASNQSTVLYCFAPVAGYSAFGSYTGNSSDDGPFVFTNFRPSWLLIKVAGTANDWVIHDNKRDTFNASDSVLKPNTTDSENTSTSNHVDFLSNGFKIRNSQSKWNGGYTYVYAAFGEPFKTARAR